LKRTLTVVLTLLAAPLAWSAEVEGLIEKPSPYTVAETMDRLETVLEGKGITVALRWDHGGNAADVDIDMRDTQVLIFGNPKIGSHLMTSAQSAGIDLPMKALAWRDADGRVWLAYNDPSYIAARHGIDDRAETVAKMSGALDALTDAAVAAE